MTEFGSCDTELSKPITFSNNENKSLKDYFTNRKSEPKSERNKNDRHYEGGGSKKSRVINLLCGGHWGYSKLQRESRRGSLAGQNAGKGEAKRGANSVCRIGSPGEMCKAKGGVLQGAIHQTDRGAGKEIASKRLPEKWGGKR